MAKRRNLNTVDDDDEDYFRNEDFQNLIPNVEERFTFKTAAKNSRLPYDSLSELESSYFKNIDCINYLNIRNAILKIWLEKPKICITKNLIQTKLKFVDKKNYKLAELILNFLTRYGYINYGVFGGNLPENCLNPNNKNKKIIIIGAGTAGLVAARQLLFFGFDVILLEASKRIGGRCYAFYKNELFFDAGNILVSGIEGNPIRTVMKQLNLNAKKIRPKLKLYLDGYLVNKRKVWFMQKIFMMFLRTLYYITLEKGITEINGEQLSPETIFDSFIYFLEVAATSKALDHAKKLGKMEEKFNINFQALITEVDQFLKKNDIFSMLTDLNTDLFVRLEDIRNSELAEEDPPQFNDKIVFNESLFNDDNDLNFDRLIKSHLAFLKCVRYEKLFMDYGQLKEKLIADKFNGSNEFFSIDDRRIIEWFFGVMEYFVGAHLHEYSLKKFAENEFDMDHYILPDGYMNIMQALYSNRCSMKIMKRTQAQKILIENDCIKVVISKDNKENVLTGDAVICTLPLGVLKKSIDDDVTFTNKVTFEPPLPENKKLAIERLGFGTVNKVIIGFEYNFWEGENQFIGNVALSRECRGEFLKTFFNCLPDNETNKNINKKKKKLQRCTVTSIICGQSIESMANTPDEIIISKCYNGLKEIYENIPTCIETLITHWEKEPFYMGTHSFISTKSSMDDYKILAEPVSLDKQEPRLFFAGEHTNNEYPATTHGAFLSGLRAAAEVANRFDPLSFSL